MALHILQIQQDGPSALVLDTLCTLEGLGSVETVAVAAAEDTESVGSPHTAVAAVLVHATNTGRMRHHHHRVEGMPIAVAAAVAVQVALRKLVVTDTGLSLWGPPVVIEDQVR